MSGRDRPPLNVEPGWFRFRRVRKGPWVGVRIELADGMWWLWEDGERKHPGYLSEALDASIEQALIDGDAFKHPLLRVFLFGERICEAEHRYLVDYAAWARKHKPDDPAANPDKPIDLRLLPPVF